MDISSSTSFISSPSSFAPSLNEQKAKRRSGQVLGFSETSEASPTPPNKKVSMPNINVPLPWWFRFHLAAQIGDFELLKSEIEEIHRRGHENEAEAQAQETSRQLINVVDFEGRSALQKGNLFMRKRFSLSLYLYLFLFLLFYRVNYSSTTQKAVFAGTLPCVKLLLSSGANPLQKDPGGCNALHFAVAGRHIACLRELLSGKDLAYRERVLYPSSSSSSLSLTSGSEAPSYLPPLSSLVLDEVIEVRTTREYVRVVLSSTSPSYSGAALSNSGSSSSSPLTTSSSSTSLDLSIFSGDKLSVYSENADMISVMSNSGVKRGKWYFEVTLLNDCSSLRIGWLMKAHSALSDSMGIGLGHDEYSFSYEGGR
jgi:ankyrin repeat protein